ncbi:MAG: zinc ribbon domain-containing protein [Oscillospiraceae bacterium]|nr:zinc ribbon domain-containing protein [Oscillospiraceae bacterium]
MTIDEILQQAKAVAEAAGKKTGKVVEVTKLKVQAAGISKDISDEMENLGRAVYEAHKAGADAGDKIKDSVEKIDTLQEALDLVQNAIYTHKGMKRCDECSTFNPDDADYCKRCGHHFG